MLGQNFMKPWKAFFLFLLLSGFFAAPIRAEKMPLWEAGAGAAYIDFPHYRGSNEREAYILPVPYFIYRGDVLKVDRQRVRGLFFKNDYAEVDVSINGSVPVKNNVARRGMPNLDPTLEIGPSLNVHLYKAISNDIRLDLRIPVRSVLASDFSYVKDIGWMFQPQLNLDVENLFGKKGWTMGMGLSPIFTDQRYNQYFYGVDSRYAAPGRPAYSAKGGYAGSQWVAAMSRRYPKMWVSGFIKWDTLRGAVFEESPLVKTREYVTYGFAISWALTESKVQVESE